MKWNTRTRILVLLALAASILLGTAVIVGAQDQRQPVPAAVAPTQPAEQPAWTANQLENLVAPIALYPDPLLSQVLVASTYPLEVVEASQWVDRNKNLRGQALIDAARQQPWDPSIQTLVTIPDALGRLNEDIQWTTDLGNAFLSQESDLMNAVQRMRARAEANGRLASTSQQKVTVQNQGGDRVVVIEPAYPDVIYVPVYDPIYVWGPPVYGYYPGLYYPRYSFGFSIGFNVGYCFADWGGWWFWGWGPNWHSHSVIVNNYFFNRYGFQRHWRGDDRGRMAWVHDPVHRLSVPYRNHQVAERFGGRASGIRELSRAVAEQRRSGARFDGPRENSFAGRNSDQGLRHTSLPGQHSQSPRQNGFQSNENRTAPQVQRNQNREQLRTQAPQQYRSQPQRYNESPRVVPFGGQRETQNQGQRQYRAAPQMNRAPEVQRYQGSPHVQQQRSMSQQNVQATPRFHSAPQTSAPKFSGGGSRSGSGNNRGGDGGHNHDKGHGR